MIIICTKEEYAYILRKCFHTEAFDACRGCLLEGHFKDGCPGIEKAVEIEISAQGIDGDTNG